MTKVVKKKLLILFVPIVLIYLSYVIFVLVIGSHPVVSRADEEIVEISDNQIKDIFMLHYTGKIDHRMNKMLPLFSLVREFNDSPEKRERNSLAYFASELSIAEHMKNVISEQNQLRRQYAAVWYSWTRDGEEALNLVLANLYIGGGTFGVGKGAAAYFGKDLDSLSVEEKVELIIRSQLGDVADSNSELFNERKAELMKEYLDSNIAGI